MALSTESHDPMREMGPASAAAAITPADSDLDTTTCAVYVGVGGDLTVVMSRDGSTTTLFANVVAGTLLPIRCKQIRSTGTTASSIVALYR